MKRVMGIRDVFLVQHHHFLPDQSPFRTTHIGAKLITVVAVFAKSASVYGCRLSILILTKG